MLLRDLLRRAAAPEGLVCLWKDERWLLHLLRRVNPTLLVVVLLKGSQASGAKEVVVPGCTSRMILTQGLAKTMWTGLKSLNWAAHAAHHKTVEALLGRD